MTVGLYSFAPFAVEGALAHIYTSTTRIYLGISPRFDLSPHGGPILVTLALNYMSQMAQAVNLHPNKSCTYRCIYIWDVKDCHCQSILILSFLTASRWAEGKEDGKYKYSQPCLVIGSVTLCRITEFVGISKHIGCPSIGEPSPVFTETRPKYLTE